MRVALVHDYLSQAGGAERVLKALHELWPEAPIFSLFYDKEKITDFSQARVHQSFLARLPLIKSHYQWYLPFMPLATERYDLENFDVVISSTSAFAKGLLSPPETLHISYCHTPTRYLWSDTHKYIADLKYGWFLKIALPRFISRLRLWDKMSADRVDHFIANSKTIQYRIQKYYRRDSDVVYPPVNTQLFSVAPVVKDYFVAGGRLVPYKMFDLIILVFNRLRYPLKIFGTGPELARLKALAKPNITFLGRISETEKAKLLGEARAFIHPQVEDLGITAIESMASGRPVIAYAQGGATETVISEQTGTFFYRQSWEALLNAVLHFNYEHWDSEKIREHAQKFSVDIFKSTMKQYVEHRYEEFRRGFRQQALIK